MKKKPGKYARPLAFRAKKFVVVVQCLYFIYQFKSIYFTEKIIHG